MLLMYVFNLTLDLIFNITLTIITMVKLNLSLIFMQESITAL